MMTGKDFLKSPVLSCWRRVYSEWEDVLHLMQIPHSINAEFNNQCILSRIINELGLLQGNELLGPFFELLRLHVHIHKYTLLSQLEENTRIPFVVSSQQPISRNRFLDCCAQLCGI